MANTFIGVLRYKNFLKIWTSQVTSQLAYNILNFVIILHIYELTGSSASISLVLIASAIPSVIFGPFSGVIADRFDYKKILTYTNFLRFVAVIFLIFSKNNVLALLEIVFLISLVAQFFTPAESASIPLIVNKDKLVAANSVIMTTTYATILIGYSLAGPLMSLLTTRGAFLLCCALYIIATYSVSIMRKYDHKVVKGITLSTLAVDIEHIWKETKDGINHLRHSEDIWRPMIKLALGWTMLGAFVVLMPGFAESELNIAAKLIGPLIIAPAGIGLLAGAYYLDRRKKYNFDRATDKGFIFAGVSLLLFSIYRYYQFLFFGKLLAIVFVIGMGLASSVVYISTQTTLHLNSDDKVRGRIFGISSMLLNLGMSIPAIFFAGIADIISPFAAMLLVAILAMGYGLYNFYISEI